MKKNFQHLSFLMVIAGIVLSLSSCYYGGPGASPYIVDESRQKQNIYYIPSAPNTPLHSEKNDVNLSLMSTTELNYEGSEVQASFMPGKHLGIMGSLSYAGDRQGFIVFSPEDRYVKYNRFELGAGYVSKFSKNSLFETYAGFGSGKILNYHETGSSRINLSHFFIQPAIAISGAKDKKKNTQVAIVSKFSAVSFKVADTSFTTDREPFSAGQINSLYAKPFHIMWEPGILFRIGWKNFQFHTGYSFSADLTNPDLYRAKGNFSMGVCIRLNGQESEKK